MLPDLPDSLRGLIGTAELHPVSEGESSAQVYRLLDDSVRYLKVSPQSAHFSLEEDALRLDWLAGKIPVPRNLHYTENDTHQFLLMSDCPGLHPLHDDLNWTVEERIQFLATAARDFHALPPEDCPYRMTFDQQIARARFNIEHHLLKHPRQDAEKMLEEAIALKPDKEDFVLTHGDMYPVNMRVDEAKHRITGFIDVAAMAVADRYTDLAAIVNAIGWHHDKVWIARFFDFYGIAPDEQKLRFYQALHPFL